MPTDPHDHPDPADPMNRSRFERLRDEQRELLLLETDKLLAQLIRVQHFLVCWYLQTDLELRLRNSEIMSFDRIYGDFERAYACNRTSPRVIRLLTETIDRDMDNYLRTSPRSDYKGRPDPLARKALEMPHKCLMPIIWSLEKRTIETGRLYFHHNVLEALQAKRRLIEDLNGIHTKDS